MTKQTSKSLDLLPNQEPGAIDSLWQPSWLQWLISALSGTVETEKQIAWLKKNNADLRKENERLAELESKLDAVLPKSAINSTPMTSTDES